MVCGLRGMRTMEWVTGWLSKVNEHFLHTIFLAENQADLELSRSICKDMRDKKHLVSSCIVLLNFYWCFCDLYKFQNVGCSGSMYSTLLCNKWCRELFTLLLHVQSIWICLLRPAVCIYLISLEYMLLTWQHIFVVHCSNWCTVV